jgi:lactose/L-arabinose transport system permease protein
MKKRKGNPRNETLKVKIVTYTLLLVAAVVALFPFYLMFVSSTLSTGDILKIPPTLRIGSNLLVNLENLKDKINIGRVVFNSVFISVVYTFLTLVINSLAGYALAKFHFKGKNLIFALIMGTMMIPAQVLYIPQFTMMTSIGWANTFKAVIVPALANAFGIFLMRQNMITFPTALIESARIDGFNEFSIFFRIVLPNMKPALGALGIYNFMTQWGSFMWPLIILSTNDMYTLPVALASLDGLMYKDYGMMMLGASISTIPVIVMFLSFQKQFISGLMGGAIKE